MKSQGCIKLRSFSHICTGTHWSPLLLFIALQEHESKSGDKIEAVCLTCNATPYSANILSKADTRVQLSVFRKKSG